MQSINNHENELLNNFTLIVKLLERWYLNKTRYINIITLLLYIKKINKQILKCVSLCFPEHIGVCACTLFQNVFALLMAVSAIFTPVMFFCRQTSAWHV